MKKNQTIFSTDCQQALDRPELDDAVRLHMIERELDDTGPTGPYRGARQRLNRVKRRIWRRKRGKDPVVFATGGKGSPKTLRGRERKNYRLKRQVVKMLDELDRRKLPEWWERYK